MQISKYDDYILACVIQEGYNAYIDCADIISADSFDDMRSSSIWAIFSSLYDINNPPAKVSGAEFLAAANRLGLENEIKDNKQYFSELKNKTIDARTVRRHAKEIQKRQVRRDLRTKLQLAMKDLDKLESNASIDEIIACAENPIYDFVTKLSSETSSFRKIGDGLREYIYDLLGNPREFIGIPNFISEWNYAVGGGHRPGIDIVSARKKLGKSVKCMNQAKYVAGELGFPVLYLDMEMTMEIAQGRMTSAISEIPTNLIEHGRINPCSPQHTKIVKAIDGAERMPLYYYNIAMTSPSEDQSQIRRWLVRYVGYGENGKINPCQILYDYIRLSDSKELGKSLAEHQVIGFLATQLASIGLKYGVNILAMTQSNRENIVSQSDRLSWLCNSLTYLTKPEDDELLANPKLGNRRLEIDCCRFGPGLAPKDSIALKLHADRAHIEVLGLSSKLLSHNVTSNNKEMDIEF